MRIAGGPTTKTDEEMSRRIWDREQADDWLWLRGLRDLPRQVVEEIEEALWVERQSNMQDDEMPKGAVAVVSNLDMLTEEPLELAVALRRLAESKADDKFWARFAEKMVELEHDLKALNEPAKPSGDGDY
jgi:hypothetical protein